MHVYILINVDEKMLQVDYNEAIFLWGVDKKDFLLWLAASSFTLFFGIEVGVLIGVRLFVIL